MFQLQRGIQPILINLFDEPWAQKKLDTLFRNQNQNEMMLHRCQGQFPHLTTVSNASSHQLVMSHSTPNGGFSLFEWQMAQYSCNDK